MGSLAVMLSVLAVVILISGSEAAGSCPLASKVASCSPKCIETYECSHGKMCCPNNCNAKSCVEPSAYGSDGGKDKYAQSGGAGTYCGNVKCNSFEVCKMDPSTKRMKCQRS